MNTCKVVQLISYCTKKSRMVFTQVLVSAVLLGQFVNSQPGEFYFTTQGTLLRICTS